MRQDILLLDLLQNLNPEHKPEHTYITYNTTNSQIQKARAEVPGGPHLTAPSNVLSFARVVGVLEEQRPTPREGEGLKVEATNGARLPVSLISLLVECARSQ